MTYIFDIRAGVDSNDIAVLDTQVIPYNTVDADASVVEIVIRKHNQHGVLALLALDENRVTAEQLQGIHGVVGEGDNGVIIVGSIGDAELSALEVRRKERLTSRSWASSFS